MRILHLPVNVASHLATTVRGLRAAGEDARGLVLVGSSAIQSHAGAKVLSSEPTRRSPRWWLDIGLALPRLAQAIRWADVLHWYMTPALPLDADLRLARLLGKPAVVEFAGGDIRNPEIESADNPYYAAVRPAYEYRSWETAERSHRTQAIFSRACCEAVVSCWSLLPYLEEGAFSHVHLVRQRVMTSDFEPVYPAPGRRRPLVVHASSAPVGKGTAAVLAAVERLRGKVDFDFELLEGVPRTRALEIVARADVYLDQFVIGSHGGAAVEAMALGKPVVCWIKPSMVGRYAPDLPIVNANQEDLAEVLRALLLDGPRRHDLGVRGRAYAERHHDAVRLAGELLAVYEGAIERRGRARARRSPSRPSAST